MVQACWEIWDQLSLPVKPDKQLHKFFFLKINEQARKAMINKIEESPSLTRSQDSMTKTVSMYSFNKFICISFWKFLIQTKHFATCFEEYVPFSSKHYNRSSKNYWNFILKVYG